MIKVTYVLEQGSICLNYSQDVGTIYCTTLLNQHGQINIKLIPKYIKKYIRSVDYMTRKTHVPIPKKRRDRCSPLDY